MSTARILVVDDSRDAAESLATLLKLSGHTVEIANDGLIALASAEKLQLELIGRARQFAGSRFARAGSAG